MIAGVPVGRMLLILLLGCLMIPVPPSMDIRGRSETYPLDGPAWSLFFEYIANICYALVLRRLSKLLLGALAVVAACFTVRLAVTQGDMIGGWALDGEQLGVGFTRLAYPFIAGLLLYVYLLCVVKGQLSKIATNISGGMFVTFIAVLIYQLGLGHHLSEIIIGSIIPLVPGVAFTNGIRDIADQDYIAGAVRMLDALLVTFSIAMGVGLVMIGYHHFVGGAILP